VESDWGRGQDFVRLSLEEINELIEPAGCLAISSELLAEGHANTNYRLRLEGGGSVVLRLYQREPAVAALERALANRLRGRVPVPAVLFQDLDRRFTLSEWRPGTTIERLMSSGKDDEVLAAANDLGRTLATISSVRFPHAGYLDADLKVVGPWPSTADGLFDYLEYLLQGDLVRQRAEESLLVSVHALARSARVRLSEVAQEPNLVHGDYKATNLLIEDGRLSGVLDWEFAHAGTWLLDAGQLFRHPMPPGFREGFEAGFRGGGGELPADWQPLARAVDLVSLVDFLGRPDASERRIAQVMRLIEVTVAAA
jgi:aminoglycoside phosphotransferase (APT) family kinase protein